jgi:hypothetical protein
MDLIIKLVNKWKQERYKKRLDSAAELVEAYGFTVVKIVSRAGSDYILSADGRMYRIGRK